jgi:wobble nucleotide-excising tRNase
MDLSEIAGQLKGLKNTVHDRGAAREEDVKIVLIYAFNATGKTRLSVAYKDATKQDEQHTGVYYNAFSEDLFVWENEQEIRLMLITSSLNKFHSLLDEDKIRAKLKPFKPKYNFEFVLHQDSEKGIESIFFFLPNDQDRKRIKISRGEERIFIWCYYLTLFEVEGWADKQSSHFFIDDPVSSLDDHNIFITASTLYDLIETHYKNRKFIITTHHIGFFSILADWLTKGEKSDRYKKLTKLFVLSQKSGDLTLESPKNDIFLYHLHLLQTLEKAQAEQLYTFHFALMRQALENIASFLGVGQFGYVLNQIGIEDPEQVTRIINALSHQKVYYYQTEVMNTDNTELFKDVFSKIKAKYNFKLHAEVAA